MTNIEKKKTLQNVRAMCNPSNVKKNGDRDEYFFSNIYRELGKALEETGFLDLKYFDHIDKRGKHPDDEVKEEVGKIPLENCATDLTFFLRRERFNEGSFDEEVRSGTIYNLLSRMCSLL